MGRIVAELAVERGAVSQFLQSEDSSLKRGEAGAGAVPVVILTATAPKAKSDATLLSYTE